MNTKSRPFSNSSISETPDNPLIPKNPGSDFNHKDLTHKIIGCAMEVHQILGNGFQEVIYQRALAIEMNKNNIIYRREEETPIFYKEVAVGTRRVDFYVDDKVMVEIKAIIQLEDVHLAQALNYLEAFNMEIGLLINFGSKSLQVKRLLNKKYKQLTSENPRSTVH